MPVSVNLLDREDYDRYFQPPNSHKKDSIVLKKINPELQRAIDVSLKKKSISAHLYEDNDFYGGVVAIYCVNRQESATFRMDSIANLKDGFKYNCE